MSLNGPSVSNMFISGSIFPSVVSPLIDTIAVNIPLTFSSVARVVNYSGTYTPNNDSVILSSTLNFTTAPNFILVTCDSQLNLDIISNSGFVMYQIGTTKFAFFNIVNSAGRYITTLTIDGTTGGYMPAMPQGTPCNYTIVTWQGTAT